MTYIIFHPDDNPGYWEVTTPTPQLHVEEGSSAILQCDYTEVEELNSLTIQLYKITQTIENGNPDFYNGATEIWRWIFGSSRYRNGEDQYSIVHTNKSVSNSFSIRMVKAELENEVMYVCLIQPEFGNKQGYASINVTVIGK